jgi:hypothetical protein
MRTTIRFDEQLLIRAKKLAVERGITLTALIEEALRETLARRRAPSRRSRVRFATSGRGGAKPDVDLNDTGSLVDLMEGRDGTD